jgi:NarL family two-component system sensor histidine kinase LiaS
MDKSGHNSSLFSNLKRILNKQTLLLYFTGMLLVCLVTGLAIKNAGWVDRVAQASNQLQQINAIALNVRRVRLQVDRFLQDGNHDVYIQADNALTDLAGNFQNSLTAVDTRTRLQLETAQSMLDAYQNSLHSLNVLMLAASPQAAQDRLRANINDAGESLDQSLNILLTENVAELARLTAAQRSNYDTVLLCLAAVAFGVLCLAWALWRTSQSKLRFLAVANMAVGIAGGDLSLHLPWQDSEDESSRQIASAFDAIINHLENTIKLDVDAKERNQRQLIKLAQQERITAILEERQRIARELHDSVKQQLFSITLAAGAALNLIDYDVALARTYIEHVRQSGTAAQSEMTGVLQEMWPLSLQDRHLEEAVLQYLTPLCEVHQIKLIWHISGANALTIAQEHALFRVVQEATGNVIRHSQATVLRVSLTYGMQTLLVIEDNGRGFDPQTVSPTSTGISIMRLRLKQVGGSFILSSVPGHGTRLEIKVNLRNIP